MSAEQYRRSSSPTATATRCGSKKSRNVYDGVENPRNGSWYNGKPALYLGIQRQPGTNTVEVVDAVKALLPELQAQLPGSIQLAIRSDRSVSIRESVHDVKFTLVLTVVLVVLVIFLFLRNLSATIIPSLALPFSIVGTFAVMWALELQPRQPVADGADAVGRLRRGRRDRHAGEHRPAHGDGQAAHAGGARRLEGDLLHHHLDDASRWRRSSSRSCSWAASSAG